MKMKRMTALLGVLAATSVVACIPARADWVDRPAGFTEVVLQSSKRNNIFYSDEAVVLTYSVPNVATTFEVRDYSGNMVTFGAAGSGLNLGILAPGWYKVYLRGATDRGGVWGTSVGAGTFCVFRRNSHFPDPPAWGTVGGSAEHDGIVRGLSMLGAARYGAGDYNNLSIKPNTGGKTFQKDNLDAIDIDTAIDKQWYLVNPDAARPRKLEMAFPNGTTDTTNFNLFVNRYKADVKNFEARNEPNLTYSGPPTSYLQNEFLPFSANLHAAGSDLKAVGPGVVSPVASGLPWIEEFLARGGAGAIDAYSFHAYNAINSDLALARRTMDAQQALLQRYGADKTQKEQWQTEQGVAAPNYGVYEPRHQGRGVMMQRMVFEQYGIPKEQDLYWYDVEHGFWPFPMFFESKNDLNPVIPLMRVYSEEVWGKTFQNALDFGPVDNKRVIGNVFSGTGGTVTVLMSAGSTPARIQVSGASSATDAFGNSFNLNASGGFIDVPDMPIYIHSAVTVPKANYGPNWARLPGVTFVTNGDSTGINKLVNGQLESWYYNQNAGGAEVNGPESPWSAGDTHIPSASAPVTVEVDLPAAKSIGRVHIFAAPPHQQQTSLLDYDLQYWDGAAWQYIAQNVKDVREVNNTFPFFTPDMRCSMDSYYSERWVFEHTFTPVTTSKIRLVVRSTSLGGYVTSAANSAGTGAEGGLNRLILREIELYPNAPQTFTVSGNVKDISGQTPINFAGVTVKISGDASFSATTDANGNYSIAGVPAGGNYAVTASKNGQTFAPVARQLVNLTANHTINFANPTGTGLEGDYYNTRDFNALFASRQDASLNFDWKGGTPLTGLGDVNGNNFSVRWTGFIQPIESGTYTLITKTDDGVKLWLDGTQLVNDDNMTDYREHPLTVTLNAYQKYKLQFDYKEAGGNAVAKLHWRTPSMLPDDPDEAIAAPQLYLPAVPGAGNGLKAEYFDNADFTNRKILRIDPQINNDYGSSSPDASIDPDTFSVRWTGFVQPTSTGSWKFQLWSDEQLRVWINNSLVIDDWTPHAGRWDSANVSLTGGQLVPIKIEYAEGTGTAKIQLYWQGADTGGTVIIPQGQLYSGDDGTGLWAQYFDNEDFTNKVAERLDPQVNFDWGRDAPLAGMDPEHFSVRWRGKIKPWFSETYTFSTLTDERVRLWINGQLVIDNWTAHDQTSDTGSITLQAGQLYDIRMDYADATWVALSKLYWSSPSTPNQIIPFWHLYPQITPIAPSVSLTAPTDNSSVNVGVNVGVTANASDSDGSVTKVEFFDGGIKFSEDLSAPFTATLLTPKAGRHVLTAKAWDDEGNSTTSVPSNLSVSGTLLPGADAFSRGGTYANTAYGTGLDLITKTAAPDPGSGTNAHSPDWSRETVLKFDLSGVNLDIGRARLRLSGALAPTGTGYNPPTGGIAVEAYGSSNTSWAEATMTWNSHPVANSALLTSTNVLDFTKSWYEWDVTSWARAERAAGRNTITILLKNPNASTLYPRFDARESAGSGGSIPQLVIE